MSVRIIAAHIERLPVPAEVPVTQARTGYEGRPGGPRDPATPGGYCLTRCYCGECPQYAEQKAAAERLRRQEYEAEQRKRRTQNRRTRAA